MKTSFYLKTFIILLCCFFTIKAYTNTNYIDSAYLLKIDPILKTVQKLGTDTLKIQKHLETTLSEAKKNNDIPTLWAYNILMADVYSIIYDNTNAISDQYYKQARALINNQNYAELEFATNIRQGQYYFVYRKTAEAFPFFLKANHIHLNKEIVKVPDAENNYRFIANYFDFIGSHDKAIQYLDFLLPNIKINTRAHIDVLNSISISHNRNDNKEQAKHYLNEALKVAEITKDSVWIGIIYGNLSTYAWADGDISKALELLKANIALSKRYNEPIDQMRASIQIAQHLISINDWQTAEKYVLDALNLMEEKPYFLRYKVDITKLLAEISFSKGNYDMERKYLKEYIKLKDELDTQDNIDEIQKISWQFEIEKYEQKIINNEINEKQIKKTYALIIITTLLIATIIIALINRSRQKIKIQNLELEEKELKIRLEKQEVDKELSHTKNSLLDITKTIKQNNTIIAKLRQELANTQIDDTQSKEKLSEELNDMLKSHIMTHDKWLEFRKEFEIIFPNYLQQHKEKNPLLTENDLRLIALIKLKLTNQNMCDLLGISMEGIKKAKQRLKKKINNLSE